MGSDAEIFASSTNTKITSDYVNSVGVDWVRFSFASANWPFVKALLDVSDRVEDWMDGPRYKRKFFTVPLEGVLVAADVMPFNDFLDCDRFTVDFSGNGLAHFLGRHEWATLFGLFQAVLDQPDVRINRLDLSLDCFNRRQLSVLKANRYRKKGDIRMRWHDKNSNLMRSGKGDTLYLGSRASGSFCRIYDKRKQEIARGTDPETLPPHWTRLELEFKDNTAYAVANKLFVGQFHPATLAGVIRAFVDFLDPSTADDTNVHRRPIVGWWRWLLNDAEKVPIRIPKPVVTIDKKKAWIDRQVGKSLALVVESEGGDMDWLYKVIEEGRGRLTRADIALLETVTHGS